jgi:hypothetical protein
MDRTDFKRVAHAIDCNRKPAAEPRSVVKKQGAKTQE